MTRSISSNGGEEGDRKGGREGQMDGGTGMERRKRSCDDQVSSQDAVVLLVCSSRYNVLKANLSELSRNIGEPTNVDGAVQDLLSVTDRVRG